MIVMRKKKVSQTLELELEYHTKLSIRKS